MNGNIKVQKAYFFGLRRRMRVKRNVFLRTALFLLIGVWASSSLLTGTWAKYVATATVEAGARVAKFSVAVNNKEIAEAAGIMTINVPVSLADTVLLQPATLPGNDTAGNGFTGDHSAVTISSVNGSPIAPGTGGRIKVEFKNNSEVAVRFSFVTADCSAAGTGSPALTVAAVQSVNNLSNPGCEIQFSRPTTSGSNSGITVTNGQWGVLSTTLNNGDWYTTAADLVLAPGASVNRYFFWRWRFDDANGGTDWNRDSYDTALGKAGTAELKLTLVFNAEQVD